MIDDRTAYHLLDNIACEVLRKMRDGKTLEEIDDEDLTFLRKVDRTAVFERIVERFLVPPEEAYDPIPARRRASDIVAHLRTLKRRKRSPQPIRPPATILPFRPEDRP